SLSFSMRILWTSSLLVALFVILLSAIPTQSYIIPRDSDIEYLIPAPVMKKSLRRLAGSNSRNCFFSPINCVITHDSATYRKLAGL
ncbi:hypothetical protein PENTCL1PPCAC_6954, partial [Pristionchus entomophagus]